MTLRLRASERHADELARISHSGKLATVKGWAEYAIKNMANAKRAEIREVLTEFENIESRQSRNVLEKVLACAPAVAPMCDHVASISRDKRPSNLHGPLSGWLTETANRFPNGGATFDDDAKASIDKRLSDECDKERDRRTAKREEAKKAAAAVEEQEKREQQEAAATAGDKLDKALGVETAPTTGKDDAAPTTGKDDAAPTTGKVPATRVNGGTQANEGDPATPADMVRAFARMTNDARAIVDELAKREPAKGKAYDLSAAREALRKIEKIAATVAEPDVVERKPATKAAPKHVARNGVTLAAHA